MKKSVLGLALAALVVAAVFFLPKTLKEKMRTSAEGINFIAGAEGFRAYLYNDAAGNATIGYGHLVHHGPVDGSESEEFSNGISEDRAKELLGQDLNTAETVVNQFVKVALTQAQFDSLVSFVYNVGGGTFKNSTLLQLLNAGSYDAVPAQLARFTHAGGQQLAGLVTRRQQEAQAFQV